MLDGSLFSSVILTWSYLLKAASFVFQVKWVKNWNSGRFKFAICFGIWKLLSVNVTWCYIVAAQTGILFTMWMSTVMTSFFFIKHYTLLVVPHKIYCCPKWIWLCKISYYILWNRFSRNTLVVYTFMQPLV